MTAIAISITLHFIFISEQHQHQPVLQLLQQHNITQHNLSFSILREDFSPLNGSSIGIAILLFILLYKWEKSAPDMNHAKPPIQLPREEIEKRE